MRREKCNKNISDKFPMSYKFRMTRDMNKETIYTKLQFLGDALQSLLMHESDNVPAVSSNITICGFQALFAETMIELELVLFGERYSDSNHGIEDVEMIQDEIDK